MERTQFTFYVSWLDGISFIKNKAARCDAYEAIIRYALDGEMPQMDKLAESAAMAFTMAKPNIDVSRRNALNGSKPKRNRSDNGAKSERQASETEAKPKQERNRSDNRVLQKQEQVKEQEQEQVKEQSVISAREVAGSEPDISGRTLGLVMLCRENGIRAGEGEIERDLKSFGERAVLDAIRKARENGARSWGYVQAILKNPQPAKPVDNSQYVQHGELSPMMAAAVRRMMQESEEMDE
jgi:hypothetical protein